MANETVRATLTKMLTKYAAERAEILGKSQDCRLMLGDAEANLKRAREADQRAIQEDDQLIAESRKLTAYYNSLPTDPPRPQALLEQQAEMSRNQLETHRKRLAAHEVLRDATRAWEEAQRDLAVAEQNEKTIDERIRETSSEIQRLDRQQG
jgi:hypothetical protein